MSSGDSRSQDLSHSRNQQDQSKGSASYLNTGLFSLIESAHVPSYQQGFNDQTAAWAFNGQAPALESNLEPAQALPTPLQNPQESADSLNSNNNLPSSSILKSNAPLSGQSGQAFDKVNCKEQLTTDQAGDLGITPYHMSVASEAYFAGPMQPNNQHYVWANRPFQSLQSPSGLLTQQFPPSHPYQSTGYPVGYSGQPGAPLSQYHQELPAPSSFLPTAPGSAQRPSQSRSPSIPRPFPPHSGAGTISDQPVMSSTSPPYTMMNQHPYYLPEAPPVPSSHHSSISSHTSSMIPEPIYSPDPVNNTGSSKEQQQQLHVMSSRPRPQCWDHGCNGREFSTFSNLLRHQREKSGVVAKAECPVCGAVFTRTTARNIHVAQGKCKGAGRESSAE